VETAAQPKGAAVSIFTLELARSASCESVLYGSTLASPRGACLKETAQNNKSHRIRPSRRLFPAARSRHRGASRPARNPTH
jgi:hypothetical protein